MNITILYPHKRKTKSSTYGIAQMVLDRLLSGGTLHEFYLPQDMPHVCAGCYACMNGREDKCGGHEYMQKLIAAIDDSELIVFCAPTYVYHIPVFGTLFSALVLGENIFTARNLAALVLVSGGIAVANSASTKK